MVKELITLKDGFVRAAQNQWKTKVKPRQTFHRRSEVPDDVPLSCDPVGQEVTRTISRASLTLEGGLAHKDTLALDTGGQSHLAPLGTTEGAAKDNPAPEGGVEGNPALEGGAKDGLTPNDVGRGSSSAASMDVHVGSPLVQSDELVVTNLSTALVGPVTLEASDPDARNPLPADGAEVSPSHAFNIVPVDAPQQAVHQCFQLWVFLYFSPLSR
jgi:hypothetical protein